MTARGYWIYETTGVLRPAVEAYLRREHLDDGDISALRAYLRQWIFAPVWGIDVGLFALRARIDSLTSREAIDRWLDDALKIGIDPL